MHLVENDTDTRLAVLMPGLGAVATTFIAGVLAMDRGQHAPVGSVTQLATIPPRTKKGSPVPLTKALALPELGDLVFGAWDPVPDDAYAAAKEAGVLTGEDLAPLEDALRAIEPMPAVFDPAYVANIQPRNTKSGTRRELADAVRDDIRRFKREHECGRAVMIWCASTEAYRPLSPVHRSMEAFERGLDLDDHDIAPSQIYAYAAIKEGIPYINGAPNLTVEIPALVQLAEIYHVPLAGKDFKTGQTLMKTILAPGLRARHLGVRGWFSTNILGNRDGAVLDAPENFKTKELSKLGVLDTILDGGAHPDLYGDISHAVRINYYRPRGDAKEGWDNIDIFGWMGYAMQIKVNFLCRDSILAAPIVLDLVLLMDAAARAGLAGIQEWLSFFFKAPHTTNPAAQPVHDLFEQERMLNSTLSSLAELLSQTGREALASKAMKCLVAAPSVPSSPR